jgi:hypothetical protein
MNEGTQANRLVVLDRVHEQQVARLRTSEINRNWIVLEESDVRADRAAE